MRFTNLQALRILGAGIVLLCHLRHFAHDRMGLSSSLLDWIYDYLSAPTLAVFFAMSGFVLVHSLRTVSAKQFILNRLVRVFPAYWIAVAVAIALKTAQGNRFFWDNRLIPGLLLVPVGVGNADYRLGVEWTLVFEVFFYAALGLMLVVSRRFGPTVGPLAWLAGVLAAAIVREPGVYDPLPTVTQIAFSPLTAPFLLGALAVHLLRFPELLRQAAPVLAPTLFAVSKLIPRWDWSAIVVGVAAALFVAWAAVARQLAAESPLVVYGDWSYGVYLLHVPVLTAVMDVLLHKNRAYPSWDLVAVAGFAALLVGLTFGRFESALYRRLRSLVRRRPAAAPEPTILKLPTVPIRRAQAA